MKIKLLFITFFLGILFVHGQNDYAILIKSQPLPRSVWPPGDNEATHTIMAGPSNSCDLFFANQYDNQAKYCFFYITGNPTELKFYESVGLSQICGNTIRTKAYDKTTFDVWFFGGCYANCEVRGIHLEQPVDNQKCVSETITLKNGWNWQYSYNGTNWDALPAQYQASPNISFKINELNNYTGKTKIYFRTGYNTSFTNVVNYNIIGCSPPLDGPLVKTDVTCNYKTDGSVTLKFKTPLNDGQQFLFNIFLNRTTPQFIKHVVVSKDKMINNTYTWENFGSETYIIKYQSQDITDPTTRIGESVVPTDPFTIGSPTALIFTATEIQPECNAGNGAIAISASGGTPPYYYMLDDEPFDKRHPFTSPHTIYDIEEGKHKIKIIDSQSCEEK